MEKKLIEMVCSHNHGRSPLAEAFANADLCGIDGYFAISSGSRVDEINGMLDGTISIPDSEAKSLISMGLRRGLYGKRNNFVEALARLTKTSHVGDVLIQEYARLALTTFVNEEHDYRERAFKAWGLIGPKTTHDQIVPRTDTVLVLGMQDSNIKAIKAIYDGFSNQPVIDTLAGYATGKPGAEFKSGFGGSYKDYLDMSVVIKEYVRQSVDRLKQTSK
jgi:hypothetical protein